MKSTTAENGRGSRVRTGYESRIEWVRLTDIEVDPLTQRPFDRGWAEKIAANFDPDKLGLPAVVALPLPDGHWRYIVIDGQHRCASCRIALGENQQIECEVIRGITLSRAAELFRGRNMIRHPRQIDYFLAGVTAQNAECLAIRKIASELGVTIGRTTGEKTITCVATLQRLYRHGPSIRHGEILRQTLMMAIGAWGPRADTFNGDVLSGLGLVLSRHNNQIEPTVLEKRLCTYVGGSLGVLGRARSWREAAGGSVAQCVARVIIAAYNTGRTKSRLPEWGNKTEDSVTTQ